MKEREVGKEWKKGRKEGRKEGGSKSKFSKKQQYSKNETCSC